MSCDLVTVGNVVKPQNTNLYEIPIEDRESQTYIIKAYEIDDICHEMETTNMGEIAKLFVKVNAKDVMRPQRKIELLIGMNYAHLHPRCIETMGNLVLYESRFGTGKVIGGQHEMIMSKNKVNEFVEVVAQAKVRNVEVREKLAIDFFTSETQQLSVIEQKELQVIRNNLKFDPINNKWKTQYPYKCDPGILKSNRQHLVNMLMKTENRLKRNKTDCERYCEQFNSFIKRVIFKEIEEDELNAYQGPISYISHHEVFKEDSASTPIRIVVNSSLKFKGISLNDILMKGPNSLNDLFAVQLRFRTYPCALVGDIEKMYHSISTTEIERHLKLEESPKTYGIETVTFGDKPAASISAVAIQQTAELYKDIDEGAAQKIKSDMYVDDLATGGENIIEVNMLKKNIEQILEKGGFRMKGFAMSGDTAKETLQLLGTGEMGRILGIGWDLTKDEFAVKIRFNMSKKVKGVRRGRRHANK